MHSTCLGKRIQLKTKSKLEDSQSWKDMEEDHRSSFWVREGRVGLRSVKDLDLMFFCFEVESKLSTIIRKGKMIGLLSWQRG